jgi:molybdate transport system substrate-binding protein
MSASRRFAPLFALALLVAACSAGTSGAPSAAGTTPSAAPSLAASSAPTSAAQVDLTVYGAASLKKAFADLQTAYETANPGVKLTMSFDASSALETQIEQGAPADVFASADTKNPQKLVDGGLAAGPITNFAGNTLTVIVPTANPGGVSTPADLAKAGLKVVAAGDDVPITKYADQLLDNLAKVTGYPADFAGKVKANIVSKEDNVAAVVSKIELGEGDAAVVYVTDAKNSSKVTPIEVPDTANVPATYGAVPVKASRIPEAAAAFISWLAGPEGQAILAKYGFLPPS